MLALRRVYLYSVVPLVMILVQELVITPRRPLINTSSPANTDCPVRYKFMVLLKEEAVVSHSLEMIEGVTNWYVMLIETESLQSE